MEFLSLSRGRSSARNVPSYEERGEMDVFAGYSPLPNTTPLMPFSKSLNDTVVTDWEFKIINSELQKNFELKEAVRFKLKVRTGPGPDIEKLKQQLRNDVRGEFQKKILNAE